MQLPCAMQLHARKLCYMNVNPRSGDLEYSDFDEVSGSLEMLEASFLCNVQLVFAEIGSNRGGIPIAEDFNWLERLEFISKIAAAALALTYVSGYLIATSFLSRFGISADSSDLLRAKYLYIGFLYWMFVTIIGALGRALALLFRAIKSSETISEEEKVRATELFEGGALDGTGSQQRWRPLRRWIVLSLVLVPFALQVILLDPTDVRAYVPLESILLLSIALYQTTFYRQYSKSGYVWGFLYGQWYVERIRISCAIVPGILAALSMIGRAIRPWVFSDHTNEVVNFGLRVVLRRGYHLVDIGRSSWVFWIFAAVLLLFLSFAALFVTLSTENLRWLEENGLAQKFHGSPLRRAVKLIRDCTFLIMHAARVFFIEQNGENKKLAKREWRTVLDCFVLPLITGLYSYLALTVLRNDKSDFNARVLGFGTLILALIVISNVFIILMMRRDLGIALKLNRKQNLDDGLLHRSDVWFVRVLMVAILYIVSVLGFAYRIYPFVPVQKAGGDYSTTDAVTVHLASSAECSSDLENEISTSQQYIVLSEDSNWIYLAPSVGAGSGGGPTCWRWGPFCGSPPDENDNATEDLSRPKVYTINRRCVASTATVIQHK